MSAPEKIETEDNCGDRMYVYHHAMMKDHRGIENHSRLRFFLFMVVHFHVLKHRFLQPGVITETIFYACMISCWNRYSNGL
jgi:hypothetical protein